ncbi:MAG: hypothetical protein ABIN91_12515 [Mucilaginibacter sp.]|uniref:hypothetical protein n=1 Tax=Mucilaginibacter sp. TaxID=1882438 RepID=UPI003265AFA9
MIKKHTFGLCLILTMLVALSTIASAQIKSQYTLADLRRERAEMAHKKRRLIYNDDGNEPFKLVKEISAKGILASRMLGLENSQVDQIVYCSSHAWSLFTHDTKIGTVLTAKDEPGHPSGIFTNNLTGELIAAGFDPLKVVVDFGHQNRKEVFWSMRMNDTHDGSKNDYGPALFKPNLLKNTHPEYLMGKPYEKNSWSSVNYGLAVVRDYTFRFIQEVCRNYDVDGIELDFFRHRVFFKSTYQGQKVTLEELTEMTALIRQVRKMTETEGLKRHRPILISMRVPDSKEYAKDIGLDIETWLKEGLVDIMVVSSYIQLNPWETSIALGHQYGIPVYPSLDECRIYDKSAKAIRSTLQTYRGRAASAWQAGADGVYLFNFFNPKSPLWNELGDSSKLKGLDKNYFASILGVGDKAGLNHVTYNHIPTLNPDSPIRITAVQPAETYFICGLIPTKPTRLTLKLQFIGDTDMRNLVVKLNGRLMGNAVKVKDWLEFEVEPGSVIQGRNKVEVVITDKNTIMWTDLYLQQKNTY